jgi:hypothetical protein
MKCREFSDNGGREVFIVSENTYENIYKCGANNVLKGRIDHCNTWSITMDLFFLLLGKVLY